MADLGSGADLSDEQSLTTEIEGEGGIVDSGGTEGSSAQGLQTTANSAGEDATVDTVERENNRLDERETFVPSHGGGRLLKSPGFPSGMVRTGAPPSPTARLRDKMRQGLETVLPSLFDDVKAGKISKLQFADFLAKYSIGSTGTVTHVSADVISRLEKQAMLIASRPTWNSAELLQIMRDIWA